MAKGRKPAGFDWKDLLRVLGSIGGTQQQPVDATTAMGQSGARAATGAIDKFNRGVVDFVSPLTADELERLRDSGPDKGHAASLALYAALFKAPAAVRNARTAYRGTKQMFKDAEAPAGARTQPRRTATTNMLGTINDPIAQYAALLAATRR